MDQLTMLLWTGATIVFVFIAVIARHWVLEYDPPPWRKLRWEEERIVHYNPHWQSWFAWRPVRTINGNIVWWEDVYRTIGNDYVDHDDWTWYHYGDLMDVLRTPK
jgi:hypothetical protein